MPTVVPSSGVLAYRLDQALPVAVCCATGLTVWPVAGAASRALLVSDATTVVETVEGGSRPVAAAAGARGVVDVTPRAFDRVAWHSGRALTTARGDNSVFTAPFSGAAVARRA